MSFFINKSDTFVNRKSIAPFERLWMMWLPQTLPLFLYFMYLFFISVGYAMFAHGWIIRPTRRIWSNVLFAKTAIFFRTLSCTCALNGINLWAFVHFQKISLFSQKMGQANVFNTWDTPLGLWPSGVPSREGQGSPTCVCRSSPVTMFPTARKAGDTTL